MKNIENSNDLNKLNSIIEEQKMKIIDLEKKLNNLNYSLKQKDEEIKKINNEYLEKKKISDDFNKFLQKLSNPNFYNNMARQVKFISGDGLVTLTIPCLAIDNFLSVLNVLFRYYPQLSDRKKYIYLKNGSLLKDSDIIDLYKIGDGNPVVIQGLESLNSSRNSLNSKK